MTDERCDCGLPLDDHPPLPKPPPLTSWMAARHNRPPCRQSKPKPIVIKRRSP